MKKALKIIGGVVLLILILLVTAPFLFKDSIENMVRRTINENVNATVDWETLDISLFRNFPDASLQLKNFSVINKAPFEGDTLAAGRLLQLQMGISQLWKNETETIKIDAFTLEEGTVHIQSNLEGVTNYDIAIKNETEKQATENETTSSSSFNFNIQQYSIKESTFTYADEKTKLFFDMHNLNHSGEGDFSAVNLKLDTATTAAVSLAMDGTEYLSDNYISLEAVLQLDLENQKYTFLENEAIINQLPLSFDGFVQINETNTALDISFKTPSSDFKNFLALIPQKYVQNIKEVQTTGDFSINGNLARTIDDTYIPKMDITIKSTNASFKYPELSKKVENITINAGITNRTGLANDTQVTIEKLAFSIDNNPFLLSGNVRDIMNTVAIQLALKGGLNLDHIDQIIPLEMKQPLSGIFKADVTTQFSMKAIENEQYNLIKTNGTASLENFTYIDEAFKNPINIKQATITMSPGTIDLNTLHASSGVTELTGNGSIQNLIPWVMAKEDLKGVFNVNAKTFNITDFMTAETTTSTNKNTGKQVTQVTDAVKIPDFLDATLNFTADKVIYDNLELLNAKGTAKIKDETASLSNVTSNFLGGTIALGGNVNTQKATPTFAMDIDLSKVNINETFEKLAFVKYVAPIAQSLSGLLNTNIKLSGNLSNDLTPVLESVSGNALAQILNAEANTSSMPLLNTLDAQLSFIDLDRLSLRDVAANFTFKDGGIQVSPFDFNVKDIKVTASGSHSLTNDMNYNLNLDVPAKYFGSEVTSLLSKLDPAEANTMMVTLPVSLGGTIKSPTVAVNTKAAVSQLTQQLIEKQKGKLIDKGTNLLDDILGDKLPLGSNQNKPNSNKDSTTTKPAETVIKDVVEDVFGGLFGKKKKKGGN